jgi:membrane protein DedA with SNARE-associated domain
MSAVIGWLEHAGIALVFLFVLVEQAGLPIPAYPLLIIAGAWSAQGGAPYAAILGAAIAACLVADVGWYIAGNRLGSRVLRAMCRLSLEPDSCVSQTERAFTRFGTKVLTFAKFVPGLGAVVTAMSGVVGASLAGFVFYDVIGATLWAGVGIGLGVIFHDAVDSVFAELATLGRIGAFVILAIFAAFLALKWWRRHQFFQELRMSRISVEELWRLREAGSSFRGAREGCGRSASAGRSGCLLRLSERGDGRARREATHHPGLPSRQAVGGRHSCLGCCRFRHRISAVTPGMREIYAR